MPNQKNQHKIPRVYFRSWSTNAKSIKSLLKATGQIIENDPIANICSEDYKYSYDVNSPWTFPEAEKEIFSYLSNFNVFYKGRQICDTSEMHRIWYDINNWEILNV